MRQNPPSDLRIKLASKGITPRQLAERTGLNEKYLHVVLSRMKIPSLATIALIVSKSRGAFKILDFVPLEIKAKSSNRAA